MDVYTDNYLQRNIIQKIIQYFFGTWYQSHVYMAFSSLFPPLSHAPVAHQRCFPYTYPGEIKPYIYEAKFAA